MSTEEMKLTILKDRNEEVPKVAKDIGCQIAASYKLKRPHNCFPSNNAPFVLEHNEAYGDKRVEHLRRVANMTLMQEHAINNLMHVHTRNGIRHMKMPYSVDYSVLKALSYGIFPSIDLKPVETCMDSELSLQYARRHAILETLNRDIISVSEAFFKGVKLLKDNNVSTDWLIGLDWGSKPDRSCIIKCDLDNCTFVVDSITDYIESSIDSKITDHIRSVLVGFDDEIKPTAAECALNEIKGVHMHGWRTPLIADVKPAPSYMVLGDSANGYSLIPTEEENKESPPKKTLIIGQGSGITTKLIEALKENCVVKEPTHAEIEDYMKRTLQPTIIEYANPLSPEEVKTKPHPFNRKKGRKGNKNFVYKQGE